MTRKRFNELWRWLRLSRGEDRSITKEGIVFSIGATHRLVYREASGFVDAPGVCVGILANPSNKPLATKERRKIALACRDWPAVRLP